MLPAHHSHLAGALPRWHLALVVQRFGQVRSTPALRRRRLRRPMASAPSQQVLGVPLREWGLGGRSVCDQMGG